jgi:hypothetical protein
LGGFPIFLWVFYFSIGAFSVLDSSVLGDFRWPPFSSFFGGFPIFGGFPVSCFFGFGGFPISLSPFFLSVFYFLIGAFLFFPKEWKTNFGAATPISVFCFC